MSWEIDLFGRLRSLKSAALEQYLATEEAQRAVHTCPLVAAVPSSWLKLAADTERLRLAEATIAAQTASRDLVKASREPAWPSNLDLSQLRARSRRPGRDVAPSSRARGRGSPRPRDRSWARRCRTDSCPRSLSTLVRRAGARGRDSPSEVLLRAPTSSPPSISLRAANADIGAARAAFFPRISLTAALGTLSPDVLVCSLPTPIAGVTRRSSRCRSSGRRPEGEPLKATKIEREIAVAGYEKAIQSAFAEVADALTLRSTLLEQREAWDRLVASLDETLRLSDARYKAGIDGYLGVLVAQRSLYSAQQTWVAVRLAEQANLVRSTRPSAAASEPGRGAKRRRLRPDALEQVAAGRQRPHFAVRHAALEHPEPAIRVDIADALQPEHAGSVFQPSRD